MNLFTRIAIARKFPFTIDELRDLADLAILDGFPIEKIERGVSAFGYGADPTAPVRRKAARTRARGVIAAEKAHNTHRPNHVLEPDPRIAQACASHQIAAKRTRDWQCCERT